MTNNVNITLGTVNHGTLRSEDLLAAFASELERIDADGEHAALIEEARGVAYRLENDPDCRDADAQEAASDIINELIEALDEFAPPFCYFGTTEGDGSDFGFWPSMYAVESAVRERDAIKINAGDDVLAAIREAGFLPEYIVGVTDHGNVTIARIANIEIRECWSIV